MSQQNYILNLLNIKDKNIYLCDNPITDEIKKGKTCKIINGYITYNPYFCEACGVVFDSTSEYEKKGFSNHASDIVVPTIFGMTSYLRLRKQRILCHHCKGSFTCNSDIIKRNCFISLITKIAIIIDLMKKRSMKDIANDHNVSVNTVQRILESYFETETLYKNYLPEVLSFDEFKSVKSADGKMSFHLCNGETGQTIDIVENRQLNNLIKYFNYYTKEARNNVKFVVMDMYSPYISLVKELFPNAKIVIDKFHLVELISRSLNKTRINAMNHNKELYKKLKRYWRLILKSRDELNCSEWRRYRCFKNLVTEVDVVDILINCDEELKNTYQAYQDILYALQRNDYKVLETSLYNNYGKISKYMDTSIKTLIKYLPYIKNTLTTPYHNGYIEGNNNYIKVLKRVAFGYRTFRNFKARIMICKKLLQPKKEANFAS